MKYRYILLAITLMIFTLCSCATSQVDATSSPEPSMAEASSPAALSGENTGTHDEELKDLLINMFTTSKASPAVSVHDGTANVIWKMPGISDICAEASNDASIADDWNGILESLASLQLTAMDICETLDYGEYSFWLSVVDDEFPYATIENGEVTFDMSSIYAHAN